MIPIIRVLPTHPLSNHQPHRCLPSRLFLGKHIIFNPLCIVLVYCTNSTSVFFSAKARLSKKAKLTTPTDDNPAAEPGKTSEALDQNADIILDVPAPQAEDIFAEPGEINPSIQSANPRSPSFDPPSPARTSDKPPSPAKTIDGTTDDVVITGFGHTAPSHPVALSKHSAKE